MKTLEHTIRDVMSGKHQNDLLEDVNDKFIDSVRKVYGDDLTEEEFIYLYEQYMNYLIEGDVVNINDYRKKPSSTEFKFDPNNPHTQLLSRSNKPVNSKPFSTPPSSGTGPAVKLQEPTDPTKLLQTSTGLKPPTSGVAPPPAATQNAGHISMSASGDQTLRTSMGGRTVTGSPTSPPTATPTAPASGSYSLLNTAKNVLGKAKLVAGGLKGIDPVSIAASIPTSAVSGVKDFLGIGFKGDTLNPGEAPPKVSEPTGPLETKPSSTSGVSSPPTNTQRTPEMITPLAGDKKDTRIATPKPAPASVDLQVANATARAGNITGSTAHLGNKNPDAIKPPPSLSQPASPPKISTIPQTGSQSSSSSVKPQEPPAESRKPKLDSGYKEMSGQGRDWKEKAFDPQTGG